MKKFAYSICLSLSLLFSRLCQWFMLATASRLPKRSKSTVDKRERSATLKAFSWIAAGFFACIMINNNKKEERKRRRHINKFNHAKEMPPTTKKKRENQMSAPNRHFTGSPSHQFRRQQMKRIWNPLSRRCWKKSRRHNVIKPLSDKSFAVLINDQFDLEKHGSANGSAGSLTGVRRNWSSLDDEFLFYSSFPSTDFHHFKGCNTTMKIRVYWHRACRRQGPHFSRSISNLACM